MNPNFKKKKPLPYKNLGELYTETAYHEPSISRLVSVLFEDGVVDVISQDTSDPGAPAQDYEVDKDYFEKIIKPKLELGRPARGDLIEGIKLRNIIEARLIKAGPAKDRNDTTDIYQKFIERLGIVLDDASNFASNFGDKLIGNDTVKSNFSDLLKTTYNLEKNPSDSDNPDPDSPGPALWYSVFEVLPSSGRGGGRGQPGYGELFISFFSNTERPITGDVEIKGVKIEVKGLEGRLYAPTGAALEKLPIPADFLLADSAAALGKKQREFIVNFIIKLAGGGAAGEIEKLVESNLEKLYNEIISSRENSNKPLLTVSVKATPLLAQIVGAQHLLLYKKAHEFNNFLIFNKSLDPSGSIPFICFKVPDTLLDMFKIFIEHNISITTVTSDQGGHKILWPASS